MNNAHEQLIRLGLTGMESLQLSPVDRIALLEAAVDLLPVDSSLANKCAATAQCIKEAEAAQMRLFQHLRQ